MATLTVRGLDEALVRKLKVRAAQNGRSAEAEHRAILHETLAGDSSADARRQAAARLRAFRESLGDRTFPPSQDVLAEERMDRTDRLAAGGTDRR